MTDIRFIKTTVPTEDGKVELKFNLNVQAPEAEKQAMARLWSELNRIEDKNKCLRVQFLDWLSDKLLDWSNRVHVMASKIDSPCLIEVAPRKKEESKSAKDAKEVARLKELLAKQDERNNKLYEEKRKAELALKDKLTKELAE